MIRGGRLSDSFYTLLNPHCAFSPQCVRIHGIREEDVADAPTFPEIWDGMLRRIGSLPLVAHNASFDMAVLEKLISIWRVDPAPLKYTCTVRLSRALCPDAPSHRLPAVCSYLRLPRFDHHNAADDARACARICLALARLAGADSMDELLDAAGVRWKAIPAHSLPEKGPGRRPSARPRKAALSPGGLGEDWQAESPPACEPMFEGLCFAFTGELNAMHRSAAEGAVQARAGTVLGGVSRKLNVLVVGDQQSAFVRGPYSTKHRKALELREKGCPIEIIDEAAFLRWLRGGLPDALRR